MPRTGGPCPRHLQFARASATGDGTAWILGCRPVVAARFKKSTLRFLVGKAWRTGVGRPAISYLFCPHLTGTGAFGPVMEPCTYTGPEIRDLTTPGSGCMSATHATVRAECLDSDPWLYCHGLQQELSFRISLALR